MDRIDLSLSLVSYMTGKVFPEYALNDSGHDMNHINYVITRSFIFASRVRDVNMNLVYVIAGYHDIKHHVDAKHHEELSAQALREDKNLLRWFSQEAIETMAEAVEDHRSSLEGDPRSIYGKIISSADRTSDFDEFLRRMYGYRRKHNPEMSFNDMAENARLHAIEKYGKGGRALSHMYFEDCAYTDFLKEVEGITRDPEVFRRKFFEVNHLCGVR